MNFVSIVSFPHRISFNSTYLVTISPEEVLASDVLVRVLDTVLQSRHMRPMLPMLSPEVVCVDGTED